MSDKARQPVVTTLERLLWKIQEMEATVKLYPANGAELIEDRLYKFLEDLRSLKQLSEPMSNRIPIDLLRYVDEGGNPDLYTKEMFKAAVRDNQLVKGKVTAVKSLYDSILTEVEALNPDATEDYKRMMAHGKE